MIVQKQSSVNEATGLLLHNFTSIPQSPYGTGSFASERKEILRLPSTTTSVSGVIEFLEFTPAAGDTSSVWFWTPEWQAMEAEASADIAHGRVRRFLDEDEFSRALDELLSDADV